MHLSKHSLISQSASGPGQVTVRVLHADRLLKGSAGINVCMKQQNSIIFPSMTRQWGRQSKKAADCKWNWIRCLIGNTFLKNSKQGWHRDLKGGYVPPTKFGRERN